MVYGRRRRARADATEALVKSLHGPEILHIATHGYFIADWDSAIGSGDSRALVLEGAAPRGPARPLLDHPMLRSGLVLAGARQQRSGPGQDGVLTALEASALDLRGTRLVVLSACDTGVGDVHSGDGVYGLRRAMVLADAQTQVMSLWPVGDRPTRDLMVSFYQRLREGRGRSEALRLAQLDMLSQAATSHPFYWASFVVSGDWRPLR